ncbi:RagB/SusD family nutrient uptake outer membrane protein [Echinicola marina]|uniref:RagB/SusD family nutrient uptake outer membrane protein n=1 Tax=Echinicola marina TaxID=2859768 RepID=UPI001CF6E52F|nr:RagB/SusD family nutrient uptake outer membrane protein [Echinicola marina]UCS94331.1 RagB/SusD family nutrient uptake outer membrane protein [Echinicola marina]
MKPYIKSTIIISLFPFLLLGACKEFIDVPLPENQIQAMEVFENELTALSAVYGVYNTISQGNLHLARGGMSVYIGLTSDELAIASPNTTAEPFYENNLDAENTTVRNNFWNSSYRIIYHINAVIEGLENSKELTTEFKNPLIAEMKVIRAFYYFYLANIFGPAPLVIQTNYEANALQPNTSSVGEIYDLIVSDLLTSKDMLPKDRGEAEKMRPDRYVVSSLLARAYLYTEKWTEAATEATEVIESGKFLLEPDLDDVFIVESREAIWQIPSSDDFGQNIPEGGAFVPSSPTMVPRYVITETLLNGFAPGDLRRDSWLSFNTVDGTDFYFPYKYKVQSSSSPISERNTLLRLAEIYLIRSEALLRLDQIALSREDLNAIRERADLIPATTTDREELADLIEREKQLEFFAEWGHRWFDLKRLGKAGEVLGPLKPNWEPYKTLFPIPQDELEQNPNLIQNTGY